MNPDCHAEHVVSFTGGPLGRDTGQGGKWEPCAEIEDAAAHPLAFLSVAKVACEAARWPEQHRDDCAWCAYCRDLRTGTTKPPAAHHAGGNVGAAGGSGPG